MPYARLRNLCIFIFFLYFILFYFRIQVSHIHDKYGTICSTTIHHSKLWIILAMENIDF